uniref:Suppressor of IKBKE 1 n=1 Tax=Malurus cyaneus samueli TaxID=2593467 RepID=A0A8C5U6B2_9PASS
MREAGAGCADQVSAAGRAPCLGRARRGGRTDPRISVGPKRLDRPRVSSAGPVPAAERPDPSRLRPHVVLAQENTQIRDLQQENRELWVSLEEHQDALELIMSKYRKQMLQLLEGRKGEDAEPVLKVHQANSGEIESQIDRICEMGKVMRKAVQVDDEQFFKVQEKLAQLELENKELRELLSISKESFEVGREDLPDCEA